MEAEKIRQLTLDELKQKLAETRMELLKIRFAAATNQLKNPLKKKELRKDIARILTIIKESENARSRKPKS